jgi:lipopolysaccharide transport system permease protein
VREHFGRQAGGLHLLGLIAAGRNLLRHRDLAFGLTRRELTTPFAGSAFGVAWVLLHPIAQMFVYLAVFTFIFGIRFETPDAGSLGYPAYVLAGLIPWMAWSAVLVGAGNSVVGSATLVKQADFPAEVLPLRTALAALVPHTVGLLVLLIYMGAVHRTALWSWLLLPAAVGLQFLAMLGFSYLLGALCVFVRDAKEIVTVFTTLGIFLVPALYTPQMVEAMPRPFFWVLELNPFTHYVHVYRDTLFFGGIQHPQSWAIAAVVGVALVSLGFGAFQRLKSFFGNFV